MNKYNVSDIVMSKVTGIEAYGIFVAVDEEHTGLIHISEISDSFVKDVNDFAKVGEEIKCKIIDINENTNQLKLSIKDLVYREEKEKSKIEDSINGFDLLAENLPIWIEDKMSDIK